MKILVSVCIALALSMTAFSVAENTASVNGTMTDDTGEGVPFANVGLYKESKLIRGVETDLDGHYLIKGLKAGTYDVEFSFLGYATQKIGGIVVKDNEAKKVDVVMSVGVSLDEVVVTSYKIPLIRKEIAYSNQVVTAEDIKNLPVKDIGGLIGVTTGVAPSGSDINVKGSRDDATVYVLDGVRTSGTLPPQTSNKISRKEQRRIKKDRNKAEMAAYSFNQSYSIVPTEPADAERYEEINENKFKPTSEENTSTFSIDVDAASYANMRRFINNNQMPPANAVRIEEMINYFDYEYPEPYRQPFEIVTEVGECPWNEGHQLVHIGLQGMKVDKSQMPPSNLIFLIDVSGSMNSTNKLPLLQNAFNLLVDELRPEDQIALVTYAGSSGIVLPVTRGNQKNIIKKAINNLRSGGSTAGAQGITTAYQLAKKSFIKDGNNRVILATDGDFNVGVNSDEGLVKLIEKERKSGVFLSVLGFGTGNYQDAKMQKLANHGNGNHYYIDNLQEANKVLVTEFGGTLFTIAKDVKIQIDFNPAYVSAYRLIGYENRMLANQDFADDTKDAGELGSGHTVTALYEIIPNGTTSSYLPNSDVGSRRSANNKETNVLDVRFRYKKPDGKVSQLLERKLDMNASKFKYSSDNFKWSAAVAEFGLLLRNSEFKGKSSYGHVLSTAQSAKGNDKNGYRSEFIDLVKRVSATASR